MSMNPFLLEILVCPETKTPVRLAGDDLLAKLNALIDNGQLLNKSGEIVKDRLDGALVREDGKLAYPIRMDIPIMLVGEGIPL